MRSSYETISALMKPFWKSVWMTPAASGAVEPGLVDAHLREHLAGLLVIAELDQLGLELRVEEDRLGRRHEGLHLRLEGVVGELVGVAVEDVDVRLGGEQ
jgi:hypothetical protein